MTIDKLITHIAESNPKTLDAEKVIKEARQLKAKSKKKYEIPTVEQVEQYFEDKGDMIPKDVPLEAKNFWDHWEQEEWKKNGKRIKSWKRLAATWNRKYQQFNEQRLKRYEKNKRSDTRKVDLGKIDKETDEIFRGRRQARTLS